MRLFCEKSVDLCIKLTFILVVIADCFVAYSADPQSECDGDLIFQACCVAVSGCPDGQEVGSTCYSTELGGNTRYFTVLELFTHDECWELGEVPGALPNQLCQFEKNLKRSCAKIKMWPATATGCSGAGAIEIYYDFPKCCTLPCAVEV